MGDFFKPWRRKIGIVTLVMACVFAAGWIRSLYFGDMLICNCVSLCSAEASLYADVPMPYKVTWHWPVWTVQDDVKIELNSIKWTWRFMGAGYTEIGFFDVKSRVILIHYWSITIPLTMLSAWLLLRKSQT